MRKHRFSIIIILLAIVSIFIIPIYVKADANNGMGDKVITGGQRDFKWPVPAYHNISSCFLDPDAINVTHERTKYHYAIDIATGGVPSNVVAAYD